MDSLARIEAINQAKGNEKIDAIKEHKCISHILKAAYDPFKKYHITPPDLEGTEGGYILDRETKSILDNLSSRELSGHAALETVCDHIVSLCPRDAEIFKRILAKDLRCGINIKTINKAIPGLIPLVYDGSNKPPFLLLKTFNPDKQKYPCMVAVKKDGVRAQCHQQLISRQGHKLIGHSHIEQELTQMKYALDGELCVPGKIFDEASGLIRNDSDTPESVYWVFDITDMDEPKIKRYAWLVKNLIETDFVKLIEHIIVDTQAELMTFYNEAIEDGEEGIVIYDMDSKYVDGRPGTWTRLVPIESVDCPVIGFYEGKGKHCDSLGGIIINYKGHEVKVGTGFTEKILKSQENQLVTEIDKNLCTLKSKKVTGLSLGQISPLWQKNRKFIWDNQDLFLGMVAEVEYKEKTKAGSLRQPRFKNWRLDK